MPNQSDVLPTTIHYVTNHNDLRMVFMYAYWFRAYKAFGAPDQTRTGTLFRARDFKSLVSTYSTTGAFGCVRLDSNQRFPAYEAGDLDLLSTPQYKVGSFKSYPGLQSADWTVLRGGFSTYNHRQVLLWNI